ncbi:polyisoprenoid-binding protein [Chitinophaga caeni]|uniref:Polyisoprenoid-binding protein n=1 Tax=Chitinophaga caeni TaxID=2029983 RepID=A0A291QXR7_9BACT|nr:YceI family protein [Chitinophaga caeni]ATL48672.1 polyisoprenoid-binding protein [Chitinophaga caeni]
MKRTIILASLFLSFSAVSFAQSWKLDKAHSRFGFTAIHNSINEFHGNFKNYDIKLMAPTEDFSGASVELTANTASINTDNERRDGHLQSPDFFDATANPTITFKSSSFEKVADKKYKITGDLTFHGVTKTVTLDGTLNGIITTPQNKKVAGFTVTGKIKRSDYNFASGMPVAMLSDEIEIKANSEFVKE